MWSHDRVITWSCDHMIMWSHDHVITWSCDHMIMCSHDHVIIWARDQKHHVVMMPGSVWGRVGVCFQVVWGFFWDRFGIISGLFWHRFGVAGGSFWMCFWWFLHFAQNRAGNAFPSSFCMKKCARVDSRKWFGPETLFLHYLGGRFFDIFPYFFVNSAFFLIRTAG